MSWDALSRVVAPTILRDALETSERLRQLGIPHALVGGLAVGFHGHARATKDVDYMVGEQVCDLAEQGHVLRSMRAKPAERGGHIQRGITRR